MIHQLIGICGEDVKKGLPNPGGLLKGVCDGFEYYKTK
jgi:hypothetical protein